MAKSPQKRVVTVRPYFCRFLAARNSRCVTGWYGVLKTLVSLCSITITCVTAHLLRESDLSLPYRRDVTSLFLGRGLLRKGLAYAGRDTVVRGPAFLTGQHRVKGVSPVLGGPSQNRIPT